MRNHTIFLLMAAVLCHSAAYSQIEVYGNGNVAVRGTLTTSNTALSVGDKSYGSDYSVYASSVNPATGCYNIGAEGYALSSSTTTGRSFGVRGVAGNCTAGWNFGVVGVLQGSNNGAGVFGSATNPLGISTNGKYAGFFHGDIMATGVAKAFWANPCDVEMNASSTIQSALTIINSFHTKMGTITYPVQAGNPPQGDGTEGRTSSSDIHYGFITSYTQSSYPALTFQTAGGEYYVNYTKVIPILVEAIKQLYAQVSASAMSGDTTDTQAGILANAPAKMASSTDCHLSDIAPNPFSTATVVRYALPSSTGDAWLRISDMQCTPLQQLPLDISADRVTINGNSLQPGMYLLTLMVNGKEVGKKRVILTTN